MTQVLTRAEGVEQQMRELRHLLMEEAILRGLTPELSRLLVGLNSAISAIDAAQFAINDSAWRLAGEQVNEAAEAIHASLEQLQQWPEVTNLLAEAVQLVSAIRGG